MINQGTINNALTRGNKGEIESWISPRIVETYQNGSNFYRIWSDGFIEQGGTQTGSISGSNYNVDANFLKAFTNKPVLSVHYDRGQGFGYNVVHAISTTGFKFFAQSAGSNYQSSSHGIVWYACGY